MMSSESFMFRSLGFMFRSLMNLELIYVYPVRQGLCLWPLLHIISASVTLVTGHGSVLESSSVSSFFPMNIH